ncbi:hypothetical protein NE237_019050 [Protea cynaroides]|uniref:acyl-CoA oxidase n=1 Tax=Protea cynaroides TaxID=273540 RepID=A0A9Q0KB93_9MAGN|nr:hypothetical protein NE237_019050 [Protea cynaroides]
MITICKIQKLKLKPECLFIFIPLLLLVSAAAQPPFTCDSNKSFTFCKVSLPISQRVRDLVSRLTLDEKISQLVNTAPAIPRLGIPSYEWWSESLHGVSASGKGIRFDGTIRSATSFPQVILTAASFDSHLWYRIGRAIGIEARAIYNAGQAIGMTFWAPNINVFRDPRWGRGQETPGEDPFVTGRYAVSYVRGLQGDSFQGGSLGYNHLQASACCKHFTAYDLDNWKGTTRYVFDAHVSLQDLADTYQPPFQSCIKEGKASGIMCAYNRVNGVPNCADFNLLSKTARGEWDFHGYITSDCDAVSIIHDAQGYAKAPEDAIGDVLRAGMDVNCGSYLQQHTKTAIQQKKLSEGDIDRALHNLFSIRMRLGLFNGNPRQQPFGNIGPNQVCSQEHQNLALEAARNGIVLLKNSAKLLPLPKTKSISLAVIGPNANNAQTLIGNYAGPPCISITPFQALQSYVKNTQYDMGCDSVSCSSVSINQATGLARTADYVILIMGLDQTQEQESLDRVNLELPGKQQSLIDSVSKAAKKPVILVILSGGPVDISFAKNDKNIGSILWAGYPGEAGGIALAEIIFGDHNPGGRLPITWYPQEYTKVPMTDMRMRPDQASGYPGRTYRFYQGRKVFKFGYGLSYSTHSYEFISVTQNKLFLNQSTDVQAVKKSDFGLYVSVADIGNELCERMTFSAVIGVKNHGEMAGKHSVLLFVRKAKLQHGSPIESLAGFQTLHLNAGERAEIKFVSSPLSCILFSVHFRSSREIMESPAINSNPATEDEKEHIARRVRQLSLHLTPVVARPLSLDDNRPLQMLTCARAKLDVSTLLLCDYMRGKNKDIQEKIYEYFNSRPDLQTPMEISMGEHRELCMRQLFGLIREAGIRPFRYALEDPTTYFAIVEAVGGVDASLGVKLGVQYSLWGGSVLNLGTQKHKDKYYDGIDNLDYLGCFAMTELQHGSNVQGLQTVATFDPITDEFIIDTPNDGAIKWWIGNAAVHGKFATVFAKLLLPTYDEKGVSDMGVHAFIVPIRDMKTHLTLPGIEIHDCGHKIGLNGVDNGALRFRSVRIPRDNLLNRFGDVSRDGKYSSSLSSSGKRFGAMLGELVGGRVSLAYSSVGVLKIAVTIAVRYSLLRQQFGPPKQPEISILDYQSQQHKLMPMLSSAYAFHFATVYLLDKYSEMKKSGDENVVADVHALSAGLKAYVTSYTAKSISICREACGGHGYAAVNRFGSLRNDHDVFQTFEGDNTVLLQQVAGDLLKQYREKFQGGTLAVTWNYLRDSMSSYLSQPNPVTARWEGEDHLRDPRFQLDAFRYRTSRLLQSVAIRLRKHSKTLGSFGAWNRCLNHLLTLAESHIESVILAKFIEAVQSCPEENTRAALKLVCDLYALDRIWKDIGTYRNVDYVAPNKAKAIHKLTEYLSFQVKNIARELVDGFDLPDYVIRAPIAMRSEPYAQYTKYVGF